MTMLSSCADIEQPGHSNGGHRRADSGTDMGVNGNDDAALSQLLVLSTNDQEGVPRMRDSLAGYLASKSRENSVADDERLLRDLSHTLASKRTHHAWRAFTIADSPSALQNTLKGVLNTTRIKSQPRLAFVFTGQGAQWPAMGIELMAYPVFQESILSADRYLNDLGCSWSLSCKSRKPHSSAPREYIETDRS